MYTTRLNNKEIDLLLEICYNKKTNQLNEDIFKKLKQGSSRIAKSLSRKFDEIKRAFKDPKSWHGFLSWLRTHRSKISSLILITSMSTTVIACDTGPKKQVPIDPEIVQSALIKKIGENTFPDKDVIVIKFTSNADGKGGVEITNLEPVDTIQLANTDSGDLGVGLSPGELPGGKYSEYSLGQTHGHDYYALSEVSNQFGNILDDIQGIFFYNKTIESDLVSLISNIKADFEGKKLKSKQYTETLHLKGKEYKAFYLVYESWRDKNENTSVLQNFLKSWKESVLEGNNDKELVKEIDWLVNKIYKCATEETRDSVGGFVCEGRSASMLREINEHDINYKPHLLPTIISFNSPHSIEDTITHETGHMIFDNDYITDIINWIVSEHSDSSVTKEQFQKIVLHCMSLDINKKQKPSRDINIKDLPESITKKIQNTVKVISGLMLSSGQIKITDDNNIKIQKKGRHYMSRHNEFIQHINDRTRKLGRLLELFELKDNPEKLILLIKSIIDADKLIGKVDSNTALSDEIESFLDHYAECEAKSKMKYENRKDKKMSPESFKRYKKSSIKVAGDYFKESWQKVLAEYKKVQDPGSSVELEKDLFDSIISIGNKGNLKKLIKWIQGLGQLSNGHVSDAKIKKMEVRAHASLILKLERLIRGNKAEKKIKNQGLDDVSDLEINSELLSLVIEKQVIDDSFVENFMNATPEIQDQLEASLSDKQKEAFNKVFSGTTGENYFEINESANAFHKIKEAVFYRLLSESYV